MGELCSQGFWDAVETGNLTAVSQRDKRLTHSYLTKLTHKNKLVLKASLAGLQKLKMCPQIPSLFLARVVQVP